MEPTVTSPPVKSERFEFSICYSRPLVKDDGIATQFLWRFCYSGPHYNDGGIAPLGINASPVIVRPTLTDPTARKQSCHHHRGAQYNKAIMQ